MTESPQPPRNPVERDVDEEIAFHLESRIQELVKSGQSEAAARKAAEVEFGDLSASRAELVALDSHATSVGDFAPGQRAPRPSWHEAVVQDLRHAVRALLRAPGFAGAATLTLTIGIASSAATFAIVNAILLRPLPYGHPDRLVATFHDMPSISFTHAEQSVATYFTYQQLARTIDGIGVCRESEVNIATPGVDGNPERVSSAAMSATLMPVLQVAPLVGRIFAEADDRRGAPAVAIIDEGLWRARFAADNRAVGRAIVVNGISREIVGVMPASFRYPSSTTRVWLPAQLDPVDPPGAGFEFHGVARLKAGITPAEAERDFAAVLPRAPELVPKFVSGISTRQIMEQTRPQPILVPLRETITGSVAATLWVVAAAGALVLIVAGANVANLMLVRADARRREIALRTALGAGRGRVLLHFAAESTVIAVVAAVAGLAVADAALRALVSAGPAGIPRLPEVGIDAATLAFTLGIAAIVAVVCGVLPALRFGRGGDNGLREGSRGGTTSRAQHRVRAGLVAAQMALALVVLAGSGLLMRTFERLHAVPPGFDPARISTFWVSAPPASYKTDAAIVSFYSRLVDRVAALPGVAAVGLTSRLPLETNGVDQNPIYPEDDPSYATTLPPLQIFTAVTDEYFRAMRIPIVAGRSFERLGDQREGDAIVSLSTARSFWKDSTGAAAVGKRFRPVPNGHVYTVIGVAGDVRDTTLSAPPSQVVYFPETVEDVGPARTKRTLALVVRMADARMSIRADVQQAVHDIDPSLPIFDVKPMSAVMSDATAQLSFTMLILGAAAAVTLLLGAVGLYGVLAYVVTLRRRELGIRIALGASPRSVAAALTRHGLLLACAGLVIGLPIFAGVARFLRGLLYGVTASDPLTLGGSATILVIVAMLASWLPARRAARVDPASALRAD